VRIIMTMKKVTTTTTTCWWVYESPLAKVVTVFELFHCFVCNRCVWEHWIAPGGISQGR
jgi:hypothetical protein